MFTEPNLGNDYAGHRREGGWVEVICGSMFSGKTEELIRRINRAIIAGQKVEIFKPAIDTRYHDSEVVSHNERAVRSTPVDFAEVNQLAARGKRVILAGLDMDFEGKPFGPMPELMATAEYVTKIHAICMKCGGIASHSFRKVASQSQIALGEQESYEARCRACWQQGRDGQKAG